MRHNVGAMGSIPCQGTKIPHTSGPKNQNRKQKQYCNKFNKDVKNGPHQKIFKNKRCNTHNFLYLRHNTHTPEEHMLYMSVKNLG